MASPLASMVSPAYAAGWLTALLFFAPGCGSDGSPAGDPVLPGNGQSADDEGSADPGGAGDGVSEDESDPPEQSGESPSMEGVVDPELPLSTADVTYIQEDELGFAAVDGNVVPRQADTSVTGYTGTGYADGASGIGTAMSWSVRAETAGTYGIAWRYSFGGTETNLRDGRLLVNGAVQSESVVFPYTGGWDQWVESEPIEIELSEGSNFIQLEAIYQSGLANVDYVKILGEGISPDEPSFRLTVGQNVPEGGSVSFTPMQDFYRTGTEVTVTAEANPGYFFQSWSSLGSGGVSPGNGVSSANAEHTFTVRENTEVTALFLPEGTTQDPELFGYAGVQDDAGTPYIVTGGSLGETVVATSLDELESQLESPGARVVQFEGTFEGDRSISIASDKTLLGIGDSAHLMGVELQVNGSRNVIIRNVAVSHVVAEGAGEANDAIVITGGARNVWVDRCELYSDRDNGQDFYDGLLEIKNGSSFVTVSRTVFRDHFKVSLISSGDQQVGDTVIRATYHHDLFENCGSRMPSIRFGRAHVFNNYYRQNPSGSGVNSRMGAIVRVENSYFEDSDDPIGSWDSLTDGFWDVSGNVFDGTSGSQPTTSTGMLEPPYEYPLDEAADVPAIVEQVAGVGRL